MNNWISVKDRLPEASKKVLVSVYHKTHNKSMVDVDYMCAGVWTYLDSGVYGYPNDVVVTHWMPLPNPAEID